MKNDRLKSGRLARIERKCDLIVSNTSILVEQVAKLPSNFASMIEHLHRNAMRLRKMCRDENDRRNGF